jgi:sterol desaturase/sphingolipid hydroxylase (fatty acid hydroxylase superfamily)
MAGSNILKSVLELTRQAVDKHAFFGLQIALWTLLATALLEAISVDTVRGVWKQQNGPSLYKSAILANLINHVLLGVPVYTIASAFFCTEDQLTTPREQLQATLSIIMGHSFIYYLVHRAMHESPRLYRIHRFHHQFNTHITPSAANAVSTAEYFIAYVSPLAICLLFIESDTTSLRKAAFFLSFANLLVHTPKFESLSMRIIPPCFVSTHDHFEHHRKLTTKYASPTVNIDYFVNRLGLGSSSKRRNAKES